MKYPGSHLHANLLKWGPRLVREVAVRAGKALHHAVNQVVSCVVAILVLAQAESVPQPRQRLNWVFLASKELHILKHVGKLGNVSFESYTGEFRWRRENPPQLVLAEDAIV